jgi:hypothetical protein
LSATNEDGDQIEWRYDAAAHVYRFSKWWNDDYTGRRREALNIATQRANAQWINIEMKRWAESGWTVLLLT